MNEVNRYVICGDMFSEMASQRIVSGIAMPESERLSRDAGRSDIPLSASM